jgi:hypothetical protein
LSASRAGMRSESLVFASLSSYRVQQVNAKFEGCDGWPVIQLRDDVCIGTWYMRHFVEPPELFVGAQGRAVRHSRRGRTTTRAALLRTLDIASSFLGAADITQGAAMSWRAGTAFEQDGALDPQELHHDLARKYPNVGSKVDTIWRNFTPKQREKAMKETTGDGQVLEHSRDRSRGMGVFCDYIPEYNAQDIRSTPEHFLDIFKFRALTPLQNQLYEGVNGGLGDRELLEKTGFCHAQGFSPEEKTVFMEGE